MITHGIVRTSRCVVMKWIAGVGHILPESPVHILLYQRIHQESGKGVQGYDRLDKEKALHFVQVSKGDLKKQFLKKTTV